MLIVDLFAGGGGASLGIEQALGVSPDVAVNHDPEVIAMHAINHKYTRHLVGDVWDYAPRRVTGGEPVELLWASPDCKHHSKAKGGKPRDQKVRALAWVVVRWAKKVRPNVIILENVEEFQQWGPLLPDGTPCPARKGLTFRRWVNALKAEGYVVEWRELRACDYGAPTTRKRLFLIARRDGKPITWPTPTHEPAEYKTAADCIDWTIPVPSIFERARPLADNTLRRIARGIVKHVLQNAHPFIIPTCHAGDTRSHGVGEPLRTIAGTRGDFAVVAPTLVQTGYGERKPKPGRAGQAPRILDLQAPLGTAVAGGAKHALVYAFLAKHYGGHEGSGTDLRRAFDTVTCIDHHSLVTVRPGKKVAAFLREHGYAERGPRAATYEIGDIGMRMLEPRELFRAQGFPDSYTIDFEYGGKPITKTAQYKACGNSVCPPLAAALVDANVGYDVGRVIAAQRGASP